jgi:hypothetical protein
MLQRCAFRLLHTSSTPSVIHPSVAGLCLGAFCECDHAMGSQARLFPALAVIKTNSPAQEPRWRRHMSCPGVPCTPGCRMTMAQSHPYLQLHVQIVAGLSVNVLSPPAMRDTLTTARSVDEGCKDSSTTAFTWV